MRRKPLFSIFHHPCAWANSPWLTKCEPNNLAELQRRDPKYSQERGEHSSGGDGWWISAVLGASFLLFFLSPSSYPPRRAQHCQTQGLAGQGDECCVFKANRSWFLRVHGGVTARARLLHDLKLDLTPCLL